MKHTEVKLQLPFNICDRCGNFDAYCNTAVHFNTDVDITKREVIVRCKNSEVCDKLYRMISKEVAQAHSGGDGVDKTLD